MCLNTTYKGHTNDWVEKVYIITPKMIFFDSVNFLKTK